MYRTLLRTPKSTPPPALVWDMGGISMKLRIIKNKLMFIHHIINLENTSLAKQIQNVQKQYFLPGLTKECREIILKFKLPNILDDDVKISKNKWKQLVKRKIIEENEKKLKESMKEYKNEIQQFPHPRSIKALEANAIRWGCLSGYEAAEAFEIITSRMNDLKNLSLI